MLLKTVPLIFRKRRGVPKPARRNNPPVQALTLVSATYDSEVGPTLRLTFDRAIDIDELDGTQIIVEDNASLNLKFNATGGAVLETPTRVALTMHEIDSSEGAGDILDATANSGIVASDDGGTWAGVSDVELPFGP
jgi:hypothetical protein